MSTYESLRAQIEAHEAEEARLLAEVAALTSRAEAAEKRADDAEVRASASANSLLLLAHAIERTRVATLQAVIDLLDTRAVQRSAQVDVAQEAGGRWAVVAGKSTELMAVADLLRKRLQPGPQAATD